MVDEKLLKSKIKEWLLLKEEVSKLEKMSLNVPLGGGASLTGINIGPDKKKKDSAVVGTSQATMSTGPIAKKSQLADLIRKPLKALMGGFAMAGAAAAGQPVPKPEAPIKKDEPAYWDKAANKQKKLETHFQNKGMAVPEHLKNPQSSTLDYGKMKTEFKQKNNATPPKQMVAAPKVPSSPSPGKLHDPTMSGKVDYFHPKKMEKAVQPARISDPIMQNRVDTDGPKIIDSPNTMNAYKAEEGTKSSGDHMLVSQIIDCLKRKNK